MRDDDPCDDRAATPHDTARARYDDDDAGRDSLRADMRAMLLPAVLSFPCLAIAFLAPSPGVSLLPNAGRTADPMASLSSTLKLGALMVTGGFWLRRLASTLRNQLR